MTSDAFQDSGRSAREYAFSQRDLPSGEDIGRQYVQSTAWSPPVAAPQRRSWAYYIFASENDRNLFQ